MKRLLYITAALALLGCESPVFGFLPCSAPTKITGGVEHENTKGCWRIKAGPEHGLALDEPGDISCEEGVSCIVIVPGETFWSLGAGHNATTAEDVDCSEVCP
jgi:hypothetical protein